MTRQFIHEQSGQALTTPSREAVHERSEWRGARGAGAVPFLGDAMDAHVEDFVNAVLKKDECPLIPSEGRIILQMDERKSMSGNLYIPDSAKDAPQFATVLAVGPNTATTDEYEIGDRVLFGKYSGNICSIENKEYLVLRIEDILAKVKQ